MTQPRENANPALPALIKGGALALGNFDGVHRGHQAVIRTARDYARAHAMPARVLTLEPHPREVFQPQAAPFRLTPPPVKERLLRGLGVDDVVTLAFTPELSALSAQRFIDEILVRDCGAQHIVAGSDFVFGHKRGGDMRFLRDALAPYGIGLTEVPPFCDADGLAFSSSRTREALRLGDVAAARHILGRPWSIIGAVAHGARRGQAFGFPTANIPLDGYLRPKFGVYAVTARRIGEQARHRGVANIGNRPTFDGVNEWLEVHLFDFNATLYGQEWEVELLHFLRPEQAFSGLEALRDQIMRDVASARAALAAAE